MEQRCDDGGGRQAIDPAGVGLPIAASCRCCHGGRAKASKKRAAAREERAPRDETEKERWERKNRRRVGDGTSILFVDGVDQAATRHRPSGYTETVTEPPRSFCHDDNLFVLTGQTTTRL